MRKLSIERTWWFQEQYYSGLFIQCNRIIRIISLLVACSLKVWCKCSLFTSVFDITGKEVENCNYRSSQLAVFCRKWVLKNAKFTVKQLCESLSFNKVAGLRPAILLKKRLWYRCFPMNFAKFLTAHFFIERLRYNSLRYATT